MVSHKLKCVVLGLLTVALQAAPAMAAEGEASPFSGDLYTSLVTILVFVLLLAVLSKYAWRPLLDALSHREDHIRRQIERADRKLEKADELLEQYRQLLEAGENAVAQMKKQAAGQADELLAHTADEAQQQGREIIDRAHEESRVVKRQAIRDVYQQSVSMATSLAARILEREVNMEDHRVLIDGGLDQLEAQTSRK